MLSFSYQFGYYPSFLPTGLAPNREAAPIMTKVYALFYKYMVIEWSIPADWGVSHFNVYKAQTEYGPWTKVNLTPINGNFFKDSTTEEYSKYNNDYYIVEAVLDAGYIYQSAPTTWQNKRSNWVELRSTEIQRRETLLLTKFVGVQSFVFRRRTFGKRCPNCWDPRIEKVIKDHCAVCIGTSFEGGYFPGYETLLQYDPTPNNAAFSYQGRIEPNTIPAWTTSFPQLNVFDIVLRVPDWKIYRIESMTSTELQTVTVRQILNLNELDKESIEFVLAQQALPSGYLP